MCDFYHSTKSTACNQKYNSLRAKKKQKSLMSCFRLESKIAVDQCENRTFRIGGKEDATSDQ